MNARNSEIGSTLVVTLLLVILLFGMTSSVGMLADARSKGARESARQSAAFYLAEGGLEAAMWELEVGEDLGSDGLGIIDRTTTVGELQVTCTDLGNRLLEVVAAGTVEGSTVRLQCLARQIPRTRFPEGAVSIVGAADKLKVQFKKHLGLSIDGGDNAGLTISDPILYQELGEEIADAINQNQITETSIRGDSWNPFLGESVSISHDTEGASVAELENFYDSAIAAVNALVPTAQVQGEVLGSGTDSLVYGTEENPVLIHFDEKVTLKENDSIRGFGTLIISDEVQLQGNSRIDWQGDIIVYADETKKAKLILDGASELDIEGNLAVLGEGFEDVEFKVCRDARVGIDGAATLGTYVDSNKGKKIRLEVDGEFRVDGLLSLIGAKLEVNFKDDSDVIINGMLQLGILDPDDKLSLKFDGNVSITKNDEETTVGALALEKLGATLDLAEISELLYLNTIETLSWSQVH